MTLHPPQPAATRVLIVEDEPRMQDLLLRAITSWGWNASAAQTAEIALNIMESAPAHIVLLDLNLPGMPGIDCLEQIRRRWPQTQVIILTGFGDLESAQRAIHLDVIEFLTKPCHLGQLEQAIDRARRRLVPFESAAPQPPAPPSSPQPSSPATLAILERQHILAALARNHGNRNATAAELGISLRTLYYRLSEYQKLGYNSTDDE